MDLLAARAWLWLARVVEVERCWLEAPASAPPAPPIPVPISAAEATKRARDSLDSTGHVLVCVGGDGEVMALHLLWPVEAHQRHQEVGRNTLRCGVGVWPGYCGRG